jgi:acetyl-CoA acetyltransferase
MREIYIVGVAMTPFKRHPDKTSIDLAREAASAGLADAQAKPADIDAVYYANVASALVEGQAGIRGEHALRPLGLQGPPIFNVENACASSSSALFLAANQIAAGMAESALIVGTEKMNTDDAAKRAAIYANPWDLAAAHAFVDGFKKDVEDVVPPPGTVIDERMRSVFLDIYSTGAKLHMKRYGSTQEQIAAVASKNHMHSVNNPLAQFQRPYTIEQILADRIVSWPLTLPMCSPISDGATAAVICSAEALNKFDRKRAVKILACEMQSGSDRDYFDYDRAALRIAAKRAFAKTGLKPDDISIAEVHDGSAFGEIMQTELLGFCAAGDGGKIALNGDTTLGGRIPVNVSGGLESKGHPVAASGTGQIHELVTQIRGEAGKRQVDGVKYALASNGGGYLGVEEAVSCVTILGRA